MNRQQRLKKKMLSVAIACVTAVGVCLIIAIAAVLYNNDLIETAKHLTIRRAGMESNNVQILQRYQDGLATVATYKEINPTNQPLFGTLDRKNASILLENLNQKYKLQNLSLDISPAVLQSMPPYQRKTGGTNTSTVRISFESLTDEYAYSVMRDIIAHFPGFLRLSFVDLTKNSPIDDQIFYTVHNGEIPPKVKSEFAFDWLGLEVKNNEANAQTPVAP